MDKVEARAPHCESVKTVGLQRTDILNRRFPSLSYTKPRLTTVPRATAWVIGTMQNHNCVQCCLCCPHAVCC